MPDDGSTSAEALFQQAESHQASGRLPEAVALFHSAATAPDAEFTDKRRRHAFSHALTCVLKLHDWTTAEAIARTAIARFPLGADFHLRLGEALLRQGRFDEAESALSHALELRPLDQEAPLLLELARTKAVIAAGQAKIASWPVRQHSFADLTALVRRYLLGRRRGLPIIAPESVFMTIGSCFAQNLARHLRAMGRTVHATAIGEDVNSTYANRYLMDWVLNGATGAPTQAIQDAYGPAMRKQLRKNIAQSDVFVITLGVAPCFFHKDDGKFAFIVSKTATAHQHMYANHVMRMTTVAENVENIRFIMDAIAGLTKRSPKFVLTLSPVPLGGTTERDSAVMADCVSKSTLRVAAEQICTEETGHNVVYWPSFEIVRWLAPHFGPEAPRAFGAEDGNTRHVSDWLVYRIIKLFLEHHSPHPQDETPVVA